MRSKKAFNDGELFFWVLTSNQKVAYNMVVEKNATVSAADLVFKALADAGRRRLLDRMRVKGGLTLSELCEGMDMSRQAVTKHIDLLVEAGLVETRRVGRERLHYLNAVPIHDIARRWIRPFEEGRLDALRNLKSQLER